MIISPIFRWGKQKVKHIAQYHIPETRISTQTTLLQKAVPWSLCYLAIYTGGAGTYLLNLLNDQELFICPSILKYTDALHFLPFLCLFAYESLDLGIPIGLCSFRKHTAALEPCCYLPPALTGRYTLPGLLTGSPTTKMDLSGRGHMQTGFIRHAQLVLSLFSLSLPCCQSSSFLRPEHA